MNDPRPLVPEDLRKPLVVSAEIALEGKIVRLEPMRADHAEALVAVGDLSDIFRWTPTLVADLPAMRAYVAKALAERDAGTSVPWVTVERASGRVLGSTRFMNIDRANRRLEIGCTWIGTGAQRTGVNSEAKFLQLRHAFEDLGCLRVEFKTDSFNEKSRRALTRLGAKEEGILRAHVLTDTGRSRDSVYYSVLRAEWPSVRDRLLR